jgi:penicillin-binding protein 1A
MAGGRRKSGARKPATDGAPSPNVRPDPEERIGTGAPTRVRLNGAEKAASKRKKSTGRNGGKQRGLFGRALYWGAVLGLWLVIAGVGMVAWIGAHLPPIQSLEIPKRPPSVQIVGTDGRMLATRGEMGGAAIPLKELPPHVPRALIAIEDRRFYSHYGVDVVGVGRALVANSLHRGVAQGGSTLTQQLAKNLFLTQERTFTRKLQELGLAFWLERKYSKAEILELYLNRVYFGAGAYGVEAAAQRYFGKSARQLTLPEAAVLAGLVKSPSRLAPSRNPQGAERRAQLVLAAMADMGFITDEAAKIALAVPAQAKQTGPGSINYVADWIMDVLDDLVGRVEQDIVIETAIDPVLQAHAEKSLVEELAQKGERLGAGQGALVAMSPDGAVRALVGGRNYSESQFNRAVAAKRQPGSAFKPFVYLTAVERGLTPETIRQDKPIDVKGWKPENYGREYFGPVTLKHALAHSLNTVSVRLTLEFGPTAVTRTAHRLGIASKLAANASVALGTSEVSVLELVAAYAPFANGGLAITPHVINRVRSAQGQVLWVRKPDNLGRIIEPRYVSMMNAMMQETLASGTARKADTAGWPAAGKTGTSQEFRDAWFIGYTANLITGVWLGNDDGTPMRKLTGGGLPVEIWSRFMKPAHQGLAIAALPGGNYATASLPGPAPNVPPPAPAPAQAPAPPPAGSRQTPQAVAQNPQGSGRPEEIRAGLDTWFLDRLFGGR